MVELQRLFRLLATGEFSNLAISRDSTDSIAEEEYGTVAEHINLGILEIYKRFKFLRNELDLHVDPAVTKYYLRRDRIAAAHNISTQRYIEAPEDAEGCLNIIEITGVFNSVGDEYVINNRFKTPSIIQSANDILKITGLTTAEVMTITYHAFPDIIIVDEDFVLEEVILPIPDSIIEPLLYYVAARVYKPTGSNDSTANADKSAGYEQKYELACQKIDIYGLDPQHDDSDNTFAEDGWA